MTNATCPICDRPAAAAHKPFCSPGCRDRDLLKWLNEDYRAPVSARDDHETDGNGLDSAASED